jgi:hypothetical protein
VRPWRLVSEILRQGALLVGLFLSCASGAEPASRVVAANAGFSVALEGGFLSVDARDAPIADVLRTVGEQAGLTVVIEGEAGDRISRSLHGVLLSEAVGLLLRGVPSAIIYKTSSGKLTEIHVRLMGSGASSAAAPSDPPGTTSADPSEAISPSEKLAVDPDDPHEDRLAFVRSAARAPKKDGFGELALLVRDDDDATIRAAAAGALGRLRGGAAGEALAAALSDPDRRVRRAAARALGAFGGEQAIGALERALLEERVPAVRQMAVYALSRMGGDAALQVLEAVQFDRDDTVRAIAETALSRDQD